MTAVSKFETPDFRLLFESAPVLFMALRPDAPRYSIIAVSDAYARATLTQREAILGRGLFEVFPDDPTDPAANGVKMLSESLGRVLDKRAPDVMAVQRYAIRRPLEEGGGFEERWWSPSNTPVFGPEGQIIYILHRVEDVTPIVRMEQADATHRREHAALQVRANKMEAELRAIIRHAPISIAMFDRDMNYLATSDRWVKDYGRGTADLIGRNHYQIIPDQPAHWREAHKRSLAGATLEAEAELWVHADGRKQWLHWGTLPWYDESGVLGGIIITSEDITERKRASDELRESEQRYSAVFANSPFAITLTRLPEETIVAVNDSSLRLFECTREALIGKHSAEAPLPDTDAQAQVRALLRESGAVRAFECIHTTKSGARRVLLLDIDIVGIGGQPHLLTTIRDITEQRQAEDKAHLYEKAKLLDEVKTQFFAGVSHELRTPLALVLGPLEKLLAQTDLAEPVRHDLQVIDRNARTLLHHVNDLLDVVKLEAAEMKADYVETDVSRLTRFIASHFESLADEKGLTYTLDIADGIGAQVDPDKVRRIVLNLLSNAFKFTPEKGQVRLSLRAHDGQLRLEVADSGPGIPADKHALVFERFRQLAQGATRRFGGTGLGLAIARDFAALHGGTISIARAPEGGSLFLVHLPQAAPPGSPIRSAEASAWSIEESRQAVAELRSQPAPGPAPQGSATGGLVLVVEDNVEMNQFICENLAHEYRVVSAPNGKEGLRAALDVKPDVIVTDMMMPEMSGEAMTRAIRAHAGLDRTPIMFLTAKADASLRVRTLRDGAQDFLTKPFSIEELRARISNLVLGKKALEIETRLAAIIEQAPDGIFVSQNGRYVEANEAGCRMLGYSRDELIGKSIHEIVAPEEHQRLDRVREQLKSGGVSMAEWTMRRKDGTTLDVEVSAKLLRDGCFQTLVRDISKRKKLELALRFSEAKATGILAISADAIISIDEDQRISLFNEGAEKIFGYAKDEVLGAPLATLMPERLRARHAQHAERFAAGHEVARRMGERETTIVGRRKSGEEFPADAAISRLDVGGKKLLTVTLRDITEQKRIEREQRFLAEVGLVLAESLEYEETLSRIAELLVRELGDFCIIDLLEPDGQMRRVKVLSRDPALREVCAGLQHKPIDQQRYLAASVLETRRAVFQASLTPEQAAEWARSQEQLHALQRLTPQSFLAVPLLAHGRLLGVLALISSNVSRSYGAQDVALIEKIAYHASLSIENARLYRAAGRAIQSRDDVLGIVAHDLRNPLNAILLQLRLLLKRREDPSGRWQEPAEMIRGSVERMHRLIQDLLDITRLEAGALSIELSRMPAQQLLSEALESQRALAASTGIELRLDTAEELPEIVADHDRLLQVFENLIGNAVKFSPSGAQVTLGVTARDGEVMFWVRDTGAGIPADSLPHLFDRFWQAQKTDRRGVGLGLPIVKGIVAAHGGRIWVDSTPGQGSTFYFTIPTVTAVANR